MCPPHDHGCRTKIFPRKVLVTVIYNISIRTTERRSRVFKRAGKTYKERLGDVASHSGLEWKFSVKDNNGIDTHRNIQFSGRCQHRCSCLGKNRYMIQVYCHNWPLFRRVSCGGNHDRWGPYTLYVLSRYTRQYLCNEMTYVYPPIFIFHLLQISLESFC